MTHWRLCSSCKKEIGFQKKYYECSVSTCSGKRTGYVFCSLPCFERHLPGARHRDAGAIEKTSPLAVAMGADEHTGPVRRLITSTTPVSSSMTLSNPISHTNTEDEILVVVSKLKNYIRDQSEMNTSGEVAEVLSHFIRSLCDEAILNARQDGRKTVMGRDFNRINP